LFFLTIWTIFESLYNSAEIFPNFFGGFVFFTYLCGKIE